MKTARTLGLVTLLLWAGGASAADDPSIQGDLRKGIHSAMNDYVEKQSVDGRVLLYDPVEGKLLRMKFESLHDGIVKKGDFYVSCADFADQDGRKLDLDFLVIKDEHGKLRATQAIVHKVDGNKRPYHLEDTK